MMFEKKHIPEEWHAHAAEHFPSLLKPRALDAHKGTFGTVGLIGGSAGMTGALVLAGEASLMMGCGKVHLGFRQAALPISYVPHRPELMLSAASTLLDHADISCWAVGCGLGQQEEALTVLRQLIRQAADRPVLFDADALNLLASNPDLSNLLQRRAGINVLTPHPAEAARLLQCSTVDIQQDRQAAARRLCKEFNAWVVLKGYQTVVCSAHHLVINHCGNPGSASAGSGDVLSGMIISLLAQGLPEAEAVIAGVWLHGAAAEWLADHGIGPAGLCSGELAAAARYIRNALTLKH